MASRVADSVIDNGLNSMKTAARYVWILSSEPADYAAALAARLGTKDLTTGNVFTGPSAGTNGRKLDTVAISDGAVSTTGTASHWAIVDLAAAGALLANGQLSATQGVTSGNTFSLGSFAITIKSQ